MDYLKEDFEKESRMVLYGISNFMDHESIYVFPEIQAQNNIQCLFFAKEMIWKLTSANQYSKKVISDEIDRRIEELGADMEKDCS